jgi:hypothetical protein
MNRCIFCGGRPLSKEHIWAKWLRQHISFDDETHRSMTVTVNRDGREESEKKRGGDLRRRGVKCVCQPCNNGWMSGLQTQVKATVLNLISDTSFVLEKSDQLSLSGWVATSVIVAEYLDKSRITIAEHDREWLFQTRVAPLTWGIWLAKHPMSSSWKPRLIHHVLEITKDGRQVEHTTVRKHNTQSTTYKVGDLYIHAMSCGPFPDIVRRFRPEMIFTGKVFRIWPNEGPVTWPPKNGCLTDAEAHFVSTSFFETARNIRNKAG